MFKRLSRIVQAVAVGAVAVLAIWGSVSRGGDGSTFLGIQGQYGLGKLMGSLGVNWLAPGEIDTSATISIFGCDLIAISGVCDGDTFSYSIDYSPDGTYWTQYDAVSVNATPGTVALNVWNQLDHTATVGANNTVHFDGFIWPLMRLRVNNSDTLDSLKSNVWYLWCKGGQ